MDTYFDEHGNSLKPVSLKQIDESLAVLPLPWHKDSYHQFAELMSQGAQPDSDESGFPCLFGLAAFQQKYLYVSFYNAMDDENSLSSLSACFSDFATLITRERTMEERKYEGLMCIFKQPRAEGTAGSFRDSASIFWSFLHDLNQRDPSPWPKNAHTDPSSRLFRYCFAGRQWFVIYFSPLHQYRARQSDNFMVFFQPPEVFTVHIETNPNFEKVRTTIRKRVETYAGRPAMVHLAHFADSRPELMRALGPYWDGALSNLFGEPPPDGER